MIEINLSSGEPVSLLQSQARKFRGLKIPGSSLYTADQAAYTISLHVYQHRLFLITLRQLQFRGKSRLIIKEPNNWLRLELSLGGSFSVFPKENNTGRMTPGFYQLTDQRSFASEFEPGAATVYFTAHFSPELLGSIGGGYPFFPMKPGPVPGDLLEMVHEILKCPFQESFRNFYYTNKIRELLFSHITAQPVAIPGELNSEQIALMYEADRIMAHNLDGHITIPELARKLGTNFVTLKKNYEKVFGIGLFPRLMQRKMEHIQLLLEKTNKPLKEIADLAGYQTLPGFINAFRKRFHITPNEWRIQRRKGMYREQE